jgi:hypothetical protein
MYVEDYVDTSDASSVVKQHQRFLEHLTAPPETVWRCTTTEPDGVTRAAIVR